MKPTPVDPFSSKKKFCWSRPNPFLDACNAILCSRTCSAQPATRWLVGRTLRPRLTRHPASPRPHAANEENAALRKAIKDADYECGVGLLRLNQLDLVTVVALPATVRRSATVPSPQEQLISQSGLPQCVRLSFTGREEEQLCLQHCRTPAVDNDSLEVTTSTRSRTRSSRRDGRCACHMRARRLDDAVDGPRAPQSGAAQQEQPPWLHDVNHTYHRTHLLLSAALHDLTPHLLSIASSGSPECRMRCAIAHF